VRGVPRSIGRGDHGTLSKDELGNPRGFVVVVIVGSGSDGIGMRLGTDGFLPSTFPRRVVIDDDGW
jgi:hypothetical protein